VGLSAHLDCTDSAGIPGLWQRFGPYLGHIPGQIGRAAYGVIMNGDDSGNMDYACAVEASELAAVPADLSRLTLAAQRYVVFTHPGHVSALRGTFVTILNEWLPSSGHTMAQAPLLERYGEGFDPLTGWGDMEVWIPLAA
jgi:AraC family transcriptional regulator